MSGAYHRYCGWCERELGEAGDNYLIEVAKDSEPIPLCSTCYHAAKGLASATPGVTLNDCCSVIATALALGRSPIDSGFTLGTPYHRYDEVEDVDGEVVTVKATQPLRGAPGPKRG